MKINSNLLSIQLERKVTLSKNIDDEKQKALSSEVRQNSLDGEKISQQDPNVKDEKENKNFDSSLNKSSAYQEIFKLKELDFSNMSIKELYNIVRNVNEMEKKYTMTYGDDEPVRLGKLGNPIISKHTEDMNSLEAKLSILSYGKGNVDPDKKINVLEYLSSSSEKLENLTKEFPDNLNYQVRASFMKEIINTFDKFISDDSLDVYQEKATLLLADKIEEVDIFI
ncbi:hypothetical protein [Pseudoalteromonas sp. S558]|uniref:hypothetical protein n=1 Tax=Pseudoalteromonas sp. S558 TaxID=2066515 RepID=UPI00110A1BDE|nr:hypothetical protein [Pseudoalteromonas sp. S558]TMO02915.1 hypothetical protein CWB66_12320 [Pseudoalteromonas sp. S558]